MRINKKNIFFSILSILTITLISFSYNIESRALLEATIQSGIIKYPDEFNLMHVVSINSWSLPIQIISVLVKNGFSTSIISKMILFISTFMFFVGIYLITKTLTGSTLLAFLISFLVIFLRKNFGILDYPTMMFSEHTNSLMAQALSTLIFAFLINSNFKLGFFFSAILLSVHLTIGLWVNFIIFLTLIFKFKIYKNIILNKKILASIFLGLIITLIRKFSVTTEHIHTIIGETSINFDDIKSIVQVHNELENQVDVMQIVDRYNIEFQSIRKICKIIVDVDRNMSVN